jgi:uncharacterized protein (TIGR01777 family)
VTERKRVIVIGATGLIGKAVCQQLTSAGYDVIVLSRDPVSARAKVPGAANYLAWTPDSGASWPAALQNSWAVINLAGASIGGQRWTAAYKQELRESRIEGTRQLVQALAAVEPRPAVLINGSAVGYYGATDATPLAENAPPGRDFLATLVCDWESAAAEAAQLGVRTVLLRTGVVLDRHAGALPQLAMPFKFFVGGPVLPGTQWLSWIHLADEVGLIQFALENEQVSGPLNACAPQAQTNRDFSAALAAALGRPSWLPVPGFALRLLLGEFAETVITGQHVIPKKALELGYQFQYPTSTEALQALLA